MYEALLRALATSANETEIQTAYLTMIEIDMQPSKTFLVYATDMFRRLSVNDQPVSIHTMMQRGCPRNDWAEAIMRHMSTSSVPEEDASVSFEQWLLRLAKVSADELHVLFQAMVKTQYGHSCAVSHSLENPANDDEIRESDLESSDVPAKTTFWCICRLC